MKVLVDTSVWSLALRRNTEHTENQSFVHELEELLLDAKISILGIIRQELLSGISDAAVFNRLKKRLALLDDEEIIPADYISATEFYNACRIHGIQGSTVDFLICAVAARNDWPIFTTDKDFTRYAKHIPIKLHNPR